MFGLYLPLKKKQTDQKKFFFAFSQLIYGQLSQTNKKCLFVFNIKPIEIWTLFSQKY